MNMMRVWVIYQSPVGAPAPVALCPFDCEPGIKAPKAGSAEFVPDVETARAKLPDGLQRRDRDPNDGNLILEVWH
jgi:hypothetical protein